MFLNLYIDILLIKAVVRYFIICSEIDQPISYCSFNYSFGTLPLIVAQSVLKTQLPTVDTLKTVKNWRRLRKYVVNLIK